MALAPILVRFYRTPTGREPVREWLQRIGRPDSTLIGRTLYRVQQGWPVGMPVCRSLGDGLYETRTDISDGRTARVFFGFTSGAIVALHGIIKKTQQTPDAALRLARERLADTLRSEDN